MATERRTCTTESPRVVSWPRRYLSHGSGDTMILLVRVDNVFVFRLL